MYVCLSCFVLRTFETHIGCRMPMKSLVQPALKLFLNYLFLYRV